VESYWKLPSETAAVSASSVSMFSDRQLMGESTLSAAHRWSAVVVRLDCW